MKYFEKVDSLRFVAIFLVLLEHFAGFVGDRISAGYFGVDLFFVISGFLITLILLRPSGNSFKKDYTNFLGRRTLRIFPIYYLTIFILFLLRLPTVKLFLFYLVTYSFNYIEIIKRLDNSPVSHFWSLCVEEQFYLLWPFFVLFLKNKPKALLVIILLIIILGYSQLTFDIFPEISIFNYVGLFTRMSSLGLGALAAMMYKYDKIPILLLKNKNFEYMIWGILVLCLLIHRNIRYPIMGLCSTIIVLKAASDCFQFPLVNRVLKINFLRKTGMLAYGIYVYHLPVSYYLTTYLFDPIWTSIPFLKFGKLSFLQWHSWIIKFPLYSVMIYFIALFSYNYFEKPLLSYKAKLFK